MKKLNFTSKLWMMCITFALSVSVATAQTGAGSSSSQVDSTFNLPQVIYSDSDPSRGGRSVGEEQQPMTKFYTNAYSLKSRHEAYSGSSPLRRPDRWLTPNDERSVETHFWISKDIPGIRLHRGVTQLASEAQWDEGACNVAQGFEPVLESAGRFQTTGDNEQENYLSHYYTAAQWRAIFEAKKPFYRAELWNTWVTARNDEYQRIYDYYRGRYDYYKGRYDYYKSKYDQARQDYYDAKDRRDNYCPNLTVRVYNSCLTTYKRCYQYDYSSYPYQCIDERDVCRGGYEYVPAPQSTIDSCQASAQRSMDSAVSRMRTYTTYMQRYQAYMAQWLPYVQKSATYLGTASNYVPSDPDVVPTGVLLGQDHKNEFYTGSDMDITGSRYAISGYPGLNDAGYQVLPSTKTLNPYYESSSQRIIGINYRTDLNDPFVQGQVIPIYLYTEQYRCIFMGENSLGAQDQIASTGVDVRDDIHLNSIMNEAVSRAPTSVVAVDSNADSASLSGNQSLPVARAADDYFTGVVNETTNRFYKFYNYQRNTLCDATTYGSQSGGTYSNLVTGDKEVENTNAMGSNCEFGLTEHQGLYGLKASESCYRPQAMANVNNDSETPTETANFNRYSCSCSGNAKPTPVDVFAFYNVNGRGNHKARISGWSTSTSQDEFREWLGVDGEGNPVGSSVPIYRGGGGVPTNLDRFYHSYDTNQNYIAGGFYVEFQCN